MVGSFRGMAMALALALVSSVPGASALDAGAPLPPTGVSAEWTPEGVEVSWSAPAHDGGSPILEYRVYRSVPETPGVWELVAKVDSVARVFLDEDAPGDLAFYAVSAANGNSEGVPSTTTTRERCAPFGLSGTPPVPVVNVDCIRDMIPDP